MTDDITAGVVADTVTLHGVHAYLVAHGWTKTGRYRIDRGDVYRRSDSRETVLVGVHPVRRLLDPHTPAC